MTDLDWFEILFWPVAGLIVGCAWAYSETEREKFLRGDYDKEKKQ